jgi:hypothetical protein
VATGLVFVWSPRRLPSSFCHAAAIVFHPPSTPRAVAREAGSFVVVRSSLTVPVRSWSFVRPRQHRRHPCPCRCPCRPSRRCTALVHPPSTRRAVAHQRGGGCSVDRCCCHPFLPVSVPVPVPIPIPVILVVVVPLAVPLAPFSTGSGSFLAWCSPTSSLAANTRDPPCEQLLADVGAGAGSSVVIGVCCGRSSLVAVGPRSEGLGGVQ